MVGAALPHTDNGRKIECELNNSTQHMSRKWSQKPFLHQAEMFTSESIIVTLLNVLSLTIASVSIHLVGIWFSRAIIWVKCVAAAGFKSNINSWLYWANKSNFALRFGNVTFLFEKPNAFRWEVNLKIKVKSEKETEGIGFSVCIGRYWMAIRWKRLKMWVAGYCFI